MYKRQALLSGQKVGTELSECISYGQDSAKLVFEFSILGLAEGNISYKRKLIYSAVLSKDVIDETIKCSTSRDEKQTRLNTIFCLLYTSVS